MAEFGSPPRGLLWSLGNVPTNRPWPAPAVAPITRAAAADAEPQVREDDCARRRPLLVPGLHGHWRHQLPGLPGRRPRCPRGGGEHSGLQEGGASAPHQGRLRCPRLLFRHRGWHGRRREEVRAGRGLQGCGPGRAEARGGQPGEAGGALLPTEPAPCHRVRSRRCCSLQPGAGPRDSARVRQAALWRGIPSGGQGAAGRCQARGRHCSPAKGRGHLHTGRRPSPRPLPPRGSCTRSRASRRSCPRWTPR